ncbi:unnamed protein product [Mytilus coruscus]|uniref:P-type domain-containing protein n=1 Tax=Mytilus coruscus TaxID=42192 RepID=A0A6J8D386_MYTCO|nr:unnamed protein product [Mytilus coruscus]
MTMYKNKQCKVQCEILSQGGMDYVYTINQSVYVDISLFFFQNKTVQLEEKFFSLYLDKETLTLLKMNIHTTLLMSVICGIVYADHDCHVPPIYRQECGWGGISPETCESRGCCFDSSIRGVKWCFKKANRQCWVLPNYRQAVVSTPTHQEQNGVSKRKTNNASAQGNGEWRRFEISILISIISL